MKTKLLASVLALSVVGASLQPAQARPIRESEGILLIIFGATVATIAISAFDNTTNGRNRANYARIGVVDTEQDAIEFLATGEIGPSLARVYETAVNDFNADISIEEFATQFIMNADEIAEHVAASVR